MPNFLRQSTAVDIGVGPFLDSVDGNTPETALTITAPDIRLKKNGGAFAQKNAAQTLTHEENGWYEVSLDATDTNTLGILIVAIHESGALPVWKEYMIVPANVYDSLVSGSDKLEIDIVQVSSDATAAINLEAFFDGDGYSAETSSIGNVDQCSLLGTNAIQAGSIYNDAFTAAKFSADVGTEFATAVWALSTRTLSATQAFNNTGTWTGNITGSVGSLTGHTPQTGDAYAIVNSGVHGNAAIKGYVDDIGAAGAGLTAVPWNSAWSTNVRVACDAAINDLFDFSGGFLHAEIDSISITGAADLVAAVWGADQSLNAADGTTGESLFIAGQNLLPAITPNWLTAAGLATDAVSEIVAAIGGVGAFAITVTVNDGAAPLQNVAVSIYDGGGALAGRSTTDASGNASFSLAAGTYTVALVKANYNFAPVSRTVTGNQAGSIVTPMSMSIITAIPASGTPGMCVVAGYLMDLQGNPLVNSVFKARLVPAVANRPITADGNVVQLEVQQAVSNALGYVSMELIRTDELDQDGCTYTFTCADAELKERNRVLAQATLDIADL